MFVKSPAIRYFPRVVFSIYKNFEDISYVNKNKSLFHLNIASRVNGAAPVLITLLILLFVGFFNDRRVFS